MDNTASRASPGIPRALRRRLPAPRPALLTRQRWLEIARILAVGSGDRAGRIEPSSRTCLPASASSTSSGLRRRYASSSDRVEAAISHLRPDILVFLNAVRRLRLKLDELPRCTGTAIGRARADVMLRAPASRSDIRGMFEICLVCEQVCRKIAAQDDEGRLGRMPLLRGVLRAHGELPYSACAGSGGTLSPRLAALAPPSGVAAYGVTPYQIRRESRMSCCSFFCSSMVWCARLSSVDRTLDPWASVDMSIAPWW